MSFCSDCKYSDGEYCALFDDVLSYMNCIFKEEKEED